MYIYNLLGLIGSIYLSDSDSTRLLLVADGYIGLLIGNLGYVWFTTKICNAKNVVRESCQKSTKNIYHKFGKPNIRC